MDELLGDFLAETAEHLAVADNEIVRRVREDPDPRSIRVVTSDHLLGDLVRGLGATVEPAAGFRDRIESA